MDDILLGLWPNVEGSGVVGIRKNVKAPDMLAQEGCMLWVPEVGKEVLVVSKLSGEPPDFNGEIRCTTDPDHIRELRSQDDSWKPVTDTPCTHCPRQ